MICGALGFLALGFCILGLSETGFVEVKISTHVDAPASRTAYTEFGYTNWTAFEANCCCMPFFNDIGNSQYVAVEKWTCHNGWIKERCPPDERRYLLPC